MVAKRKGSLSPERLEASKQKQRYVLVWYMIIFWCLHFIASSVFSVAQYHPPQALVTILNYTCIGSMLFLGGDEAMKVFERAKMLRAGSANKNKGSDEKQGL